MGGLFEVEYLFYLLRIVIAACCGIAIGFEREYRSKGAGIRTHCLVAFAAALMMVVSKYGFFDLITEEIYAGADIRLDPSRVASTIASGIGFLGAGTIFVHKSTVTGLTTAAGIWATAGVGMAIGSGMYVIGIVATVIIILSQVLLHMGFIAKEYRTKKLIVNKVSMKKYNSYIKEQLKSFDIRIQETKVKKDKSGNKNYTFIIDVPEAVDEDEIIALIDFDCEISSNS